MSLDSSYEHAWWGLMALVDDGTYRNNYFGVDRSTVPAYASYVTASTGALSTDLMQRVSDVLDQKLGGKVDIILCHHSTRRLVIQLTDADRRYSGANLMKPDAGTVAFQQGDIPFGSVPVRAIRDFPLDVMMFLDKKWWSQGIHVGAGQVGGRRRRHSRAYRDRHNRPRLVRGVVPDAQTVLPGEPRLLRASGRHHGPVARGGPR
jgi:hypothetical protein